MYDLNTGLPKYFLNEQLLRKQKCLANIKAIKNVRQLKLDLYICIEQEDDPVLLKSYAMDLAECEFELQRLHNFKENADFHRFWETPKCLCPKYDNEDLIGLHVSIINMECPLHGSDV